MSIVSSPTPLQNSLMPAPLPPDFDDRRLEVGEGLAELLGDDLGVGQHGRRTGDLDLVARGGEPGGRGEREGRDRRRKENLFHGLLLFGNFLDALGTQQRHYAAAVTDI